MVEITETTALEDLTAAHRFIQRLTDIGCGIALDDFGTGYGDSRSTSKSSRSAT